MTNLAFALPQRSPRHPSSPSVTGGTPTRHIEIVSSRDQRMARPRLVYSLVVVGGMFAVLVTQLLLSIALADGAYQISGLQSQQKELVRERQNVTEHLNVLNSPQNLAAQAESLGMVSNTSAVYLNLADGSVLGAPSAAKARAGSVVGANGSLLIPNSLLTTSTEKAQADSLVVTGAPAATTTSGSVPSTAGATTAGLLPSPVTR